jgi:hypothetical protein
MVTGALCQTRTVLEVSKVSTSVINFVMRGHSESSRQMVADVKNVTREHTRREALVVVLIAMRGITQRGVLVVVLRAVMGTTGMRALLVVVRALLENTRVVV